MGPFRHIGRRQIHLEATDSTNARAAELAHDLTHAGTVITTDLQTQGRGQHGRIWESPSGVNVLLSTLVYPPPILCRPVVLTAFAATAVAETILQATGKQTRIKWPNDVLLDGKKTCGILIEGGVAAANREPHFIVGIGLNVNSSADDFVRLGLPAATSLAIAVGHHLDVSEVRQLLIRNLDAQYVHACDGDLTTLEASWRRRLGLEEGPVTIELMDSSEVHGQLVELGFAGLSVEKSDGTVRRFVPEEVRHVR